MEMNQETNLWAMRVHSSFLPLTSDFCFGHYAFLAMNGVKRFSLLASAAAKYFEPQ
jgi:hypothetical protein